MPQHWRRRSPSGEDQGSTAARRSASGPSEQERGPMIHRSPLPDVEIPDVALTGYVLERARELGDKPALIDGPTGRVLTYTALDAGVRSLAGGLAAKGFGRGDVLALMAPNLPEYAV